MRVLFMLDEVFGRRERTLLERLEIGLADEGVRVVRAVPDSLEEAPAGGLFVESVSYTLRGMAMSRRPRAQRLLARAGGEGRPIDLVHAMGGGAWRLAGEVARMAGVPLALEAWRGGLAHRVGAMRSLLSPDVQVRALCPDQVGLAEFETAGLGDLAIATPWGVHAGEHDHVILRDGRAAAIVVVGSGRDPRAITTAMEGLVRAVPPSNDARLFMDADAARRGRLYPVLDRLGLTERVSLIPDLEARRDLVLMGDVMLVPEALGEHRTIVLDAMGCGLAVIAAADAQVSWLIDGVTARLVGRGGLGATADGLGVHQGSSVVPGSAEDWGAAIKGVLENPAEARARGDSARRYVQEQRKASAHVAAVLAAYGQMTGAAAASLPFSAPSPGGSR